MISEGIIIAIITGIFSTAVIIIQTYKCCKSSNKINYNKNPNTVLDTTYEPPNLLNCYKYIKKHDNGNLEINVPPGLKILPSGSIGSCNLFFTFNQYNNNNNCKKILKLKLSKVTGNIKLFVKRFNSDYTFSSYNPVIEVAAINGDNEIYYNPSIGSHNITYEQLGIMVYSNEIISCIPCSKCINYTYNCNKCIKKNSNSCIIKGALIENNI